MSKKRCIDFINARAFAHFCTHLELRKLDSEASHFEKKNALETAMRITQRLAGEGVTKEEAQKMLEDWRAFGEKEIMPNAENRERMEEKLLSLIEGEPVEKTYREWDSVLKDERLSIEARIEINGCLLDYLQHIREMEQTFGKNKLAFDRNEQPVTVFLKEEDRKKIS